MDQNNRRPDADALLKEVEREEGRKGKLKIFLGYSPGVGKTYTMLNEANVLKRRGIDVTVGFVETHGRKETEDLLKDLEVIPRLVKEYKGLTLQEMDLDAVLRRRPRVVLVDELAHTNAEGSRYEKRYQDVIELLDSGMDVYTTLNVQHFESINDTVEKITGIRMQETIPDTFLDEADEVQVIDIPWDELIQRLREGKVYIPERARRAMENFFQRGNLSALREIMLNIVARKMDAEVLNYMRAKAIEGPWATAERLVVCVTASPYGKQLVRKAYTIAQQMHAKWYALYVSTMTLREIPDRDKAYLTDTLNLAEQLGAKLVMINGTDIAEEILKYAKENDITQVVIGKPLRSIFLGFIKGSPVSRLLHARAGFEIHLITPTADKDVPEIKKAKTGLAFQFEHYMLALLMVAGITILNLAIYKVLFPSSLVYIYMISTIACAILFGTGPAIFASLAGLLVFDFLFTEPRFSFSMTATHDIINVTVFFLVAVVVSQLVKIVHRQNDALQYRIERISLIEEMSREFMMMTPINEFLSGFSHYSLESNKVPVFLRTTVLGEIGQVTLKYVKKVLDAPSYVLFNEKGALKVWAKSSPGMEITANEMAVAAWTFTHGEIAGSGTGTLSSIRSLFLPIIFQDEPIGVLGIEYDFRNLFPEQRRFLGAILNLTSLAAARWINLEI
jgi:two-component system sensor histidine kinase KdpD